MVTILADTTIGIITGVKSISLSNIIKISTLGTKYCLAYQMNVVLLYEKLQLLLGQSVHLLSIK